MAPKRQLDTIMSAVACVALASWSVGYSLQGEPDHVLATNLAAVGFMGAIVVGLVAIYLEIERRRRPEDQAKDDKKPD